jgi:hypothetical protein
MLQFGHECTLYGLLHRDSALKLTDLTFESFRVLPALLLQCFQLLSEGLLQRLPFLLALTGRFGPQLLLLVPKFLVVASFRLQFSLKGFVVLLGLLVVQLQAIQLVAVVVKFLLGIDAVGECLLVLLEEYFVLDLVVLCLGETESGNAEIVLESGEFGLVAVDLADVELDVVSGGGILVELALGVGGTQEFVTVAAGSRTVSAGRTAGLEVALGVVALRHNDNIIQIKFIRVTSTSFLYLLIINSHPLLSYILYC